MNLDRDTLTVRRSMLPDSTVTGPKTAAGARTVPIFPVLRRVLVAWRLRARRRGDDAVVADVLARAATASFGR